MVLTSTTIIYVGNVFLINKSLTNTTTLDVFDLLFNGLLISTSRQTRGNKPLEISLELMSTLHNLPVGLRIVQSIFSFHILKANKEDEPIIEQSEGSPSLDQVLFLPLQTINLPPYKPMLSLKNRITVHGICKLQKTKPFLISTILTSAVSFQPDRILRELFLKAQIHLKSKGSPMRSFWSITGMSSLFRESRNCVDALVLWL